MRLFFLILIFVCGYGISFSQPITDTTKKITFDSSKLITTNPIQQPEGSEHTYQNVIQRILGRHIFLNISPASVNLINTEKAPGNKDMLFYILSVVLLLFGILKVFYAKYFYNIFRVFFNTSLRQNQLTDLLLQAKLPSLIFNIFFIISAGLYTWSLLNYYHLFKSDNSYFILSACILAFGFVYLGKFFSLKFIGWVSGMTPQSDVYIFITFLINKILGVILLPFTIIIIFGSENWIKPITSISLFVAAILFLSRYFRSYSLLQNQLKVSWFQFLIYIAAVEIVPVLILYKVAINLLS